MHFEMIQMEVIGVEFGLRELFLVLAILSNFSMGAPSKAKAIKLDNPAQIKVSPQSGTELHIMQGNEHYEAVVRAVYQPQRK